MSERNKTSIQKRNEGGEEIRERGGEITCGEGRIKGERKRWGS